MSTYHSETIQHNQKTKDKKGGRRVFPWLYGHYRQIIPRPTKDRKKRKLFYSGKKKKHTVKNLYTVNQEGWIIYKTKHRQKSKKHE